MIKDPPTTSSTNFSKKQKIILKIGRKRIGDSVTESINYEAVCRTDLAKPGLLIIYCPY